MQRHIQMRLLQIKNTWMTWILLLSVKYEGVRRKKVIMYEERERKKFTCFFANIFSFPLALFRPWRKIRNSIDPLLDCVVRVANFMKRLDIVVEFFCLQKYFSNIAIGFLYFRLFRSSTSANSLFDAFRLYVFRKCWWTCWKGQRRLSLGLFLKSLYVRPIWGNYPWTLITFQMSKCLEPEIVNFIG